MSSFQPIKIIQALTISIVLATLVGCASTPKQPRTFNQLGQFQEIPLNENSYRIGFRTHPDASYGYAEEVTLLKSAQVTVQQGFDAFKVIDDPTNRTNQQQQRQTVVYPSRPYYSSFGFHDRFYDPFYRPYWHDPFFDTPYVVNVDPVEVAYTIQMFQSNMAPSDAFDARRILEAIGGKYGLRADGSVILASPTPNTSAPNTPVQNTPTKTTTP